jgi:hypothetical protein
VRPEADRRQGDENQRRLEPQSNREARPSLHPAIATSADFHTLSVKATPSACLSIEI